MSRRGALLCLLWAAAGCSGGASSPGGEYFRWQQQAVFAGLTGERDSSNAPFKSLEKALELEPFRPAAYLDLARVFLQLDAPEQALSSLEEARRLLKDRPLPRSALYLDVQVHRRAGRIAEARHRLEQALEGDGDGPEARWLLGSLCLEIGDFDAAASAFEAASKHGGAALRARAEYSLHLVHRRAGREALAAEALGRFEALREGARLRGDDPMAAAEAALDLAEAVALLPRVGPRALAEPERAALAFSGAGRLEVEPGARVAIVVLETVAPLAPELLVLGAGSLQVLRQAPVPEGAPAPPSFGAYRELARAAGIFDEGEAPLGIAAGDVDGDGLADAFAWSASRGRWLRRAGGGRFAVVESATADELEGIIDARFLDADLDGSLDLAVLLGRERRGLGAVPACLSLLRQRGRWSFERRDLIELPLPRGPRRLAVADLDRRPGLELVLPGALAIAVYGLRDGEARGVALPGMVGCSHPAAGDLDNDGDADIACASPAGGGVLVAWNQGRSGLGETPRFRVELQHGAGSPPASGGLRAARLADLDNDGDLDLALAGDQGIEVLQNHGGGRLARSADAIAASTPAWSLETADLDGDRRLDLVALAGSEAAAAPAVFVNRTEPRYEACRIRLAAVDPAASARARPGGSIGARVALFAGAQFQELEQLEPGSLHFGVGAHQRETLQIIAFRIVWPDGSVQVLDGRMLRWDGQRSLEVTRLEAPFEAHLAGVRSFDD
jgi:tetratricopeptide (TPR) repeat protein